MLYQCEGTIPVDGIQPLVYAEPDPTQEEGLLEGDIGEDDIGVTKAFSAWWQVELEEGDDELEDQHVHQCVDDVEQAGE